MPQCPSFVIAVKDIKIAIEKITDAAGEVQGYPVKIPGIGQYVANHRFRGEPSRCSGAHYNVKWDLVPFVPHLWSFL